MAYDPFKHNRRSIRLKGYDYSQEGAYFITICINHGRTFLSEMRYRTEFKLRLKQFVAIVSIFLLVTACSLSTRSATPRPLPNTVSELINLITKEKNKVPPPSDAIIALGDFGPEAAPAISVITPWLDYRADQGYTNSIVAEVLAKMGPAAAPAVPELVKGVMWLEGTESLEMQITLSSFIVALGHIGPEAAASVRYLAELLYSEQAVEAAWSIAQITEQDWPDADLELGWDSGMIVFPDYQPPQKEPGGDYLLTLSAREWWASEGQYQNWASLNK